MGSSAKAAVLLALAAPVDCILQNPNFPQCSHASRGTNVIVSADGTVNLISNASLPQLAQGTSTLYAGPSGASCDFHGVIVVGGPLSLVTGSAYYTYSTMIRRSLQLFAEWFNTERKGLIVQGKQYALAFAWVDDASSKVQVANATAHAVRKYNADFVFGGYSSGLTKHTAQQASVDGKLMLAAGASVSSIYAQNNLSFGLLPKATIYHASSLALIAAKAAQIDALSEYDATAASSQRACARVSTSGTANCVDALTVGFIQASASFSKTMCSSGPSVAMELGMAVATNADGTPLIVTIPQSPSVAEAAAALRRHQAAKVTVLVACSYYTTARAIVGALEELDFSPLAVIASSAVTTAPWGKAVRDGWFQGEYVLGPTPWHRTKPTRGAFSGMTSMEFYERFRAMYSGAEVSYHGVAPFGQACTLLHAIERADSFDTESIASQLQQLRLAEFYADISFDEHGQYAGQMLVTQWPKGSSVLGVDASEEVVAPPESVTTGDFAFPIPSWARRRCAAFGPVDDPATANRSTLLRQECTSHGSCDDEGRCVCDVGYGGISCQLSLSGANYLPLSLVLTSYSVNGAFVLLVLACIAWTVRHRRHEVVRSSQPAFMIYMAVGAIVLLLAVVPMAIDHRGDHDGIRSVPPGAASRYPHLDIACNAQVWLYFIGFAIMYGALLGRIWRLMLMMPSRRSLHTHGAGRQSAMRMISLVLLEGLILGVWVALEPLHWQVVEHGSRSDEGVILESHGECSFAEGLAPIFLAILVTIHAVLLVYGNVLCYQARAMPTRFHEAKYLTFAFGNNLQSTLIAALLLIFLADKPLAFFIVKWMLTLTVGGGTLCLIFLPKIGLVHLWPNGNDTRISETIRRAKNKPAVSRWVQRASSQSVMGSELSFDHGPGTDDIEPSDQGPGTDGIEPSSAETQRPRDDADDDGRQKTVKESDV